MDPKDILTEACKRYEDAVFDVANTIFSQHIEPFCRRRRWQFVAGNGTWFLGAKCSKASARWEIPDDDEELQRVCSMLETEIPGMPANDLGSLMPNCDFSGE